MYACDEYLDLISGGADSELNEADAALLRGHLDSCEGCRSLYEFYLSMNGALARMEEEPPANLAAGVLLSVKNEKKRGGLRGRFAFRSFTAVAAAIAIVIMITSYKGGFIKNNGVTSLGGGNAAQPAAAPPAAAPRQAAVPEIAMFGEDAGTGETESESAEYGSGDSTVRFEASEKLDTRVVPTSAPAGAEDALLFSAAPAPKNDEEAYMAAVNDVLSEHSGEFSKVLLFFGETPMGVDGLLSLMTAGGTPWYMASGDSFSEIESLNAKKNINFLIIDDDPSLDAKASDFAIIIYK